MSMVIASSGSSRSVFMTSKMRAGSTTSVSSPRYECVAVTAAPSTSLARLSASMLTIAPRSRDHLELALGLQELVVLAALALLHEAALLLDLVLQHDEPVEDLLGARRTARDVDVDRNALIGARHRRVVLIEAARRRADAERHRPLRLAHLLVDAAQHRPLTLRDRA